MRKGWRRAGKKGTAEAGGQERVGMGRYGREDGREDQRTGLAGEDKKEKEEEKKRAAAEDRFSRGRIWKRRAIKREKAAEDRFSRGKI